MFFKKPKYLDWEEYTDHIEFMNDYFFQQSVRHENVKHL